jgi:hypothetical protein
MKTKCWLTVILVTIAFLAVIAPVSYAESLTTSDFTQTSFAKTVDFFDYVREYAAARNVTPPPDAWHAWLYMTYVNTSGLKLLFAGLDNITFGGALTFTVPLQSFIMHYRTDNQSRDVILGNTFLMLLAFNDSSTSLFPNSPDRNDYLWSSFSMGLSLSDLGIILPVFNSRTEHIALKSSNNGLTWTWGMRYTNLTAFWWQTYIDEGNPHHENYVAAITVYDELTFTYRLDIDPTTNTTTVTENHVIGRMRELFWHPLPLVWLRYNATGEYRPLRELAPLAFAYLGPTTIYQFLDTCGIKMSIIDYQTSITADHQTLSRTANGQNVTDSDVDVDSTSVDTVTDDGVRVASANFGAKQTYQLFNYTQDSSEQQSVTYNATQRTARLGGFGRNEDLFQLQFGLLKFLPLVVYNMFPGLYLQALATLTNVTRANYLYIVAYPTYSGYRVVHDPTLTVYAAVTASSNVWSLGGLGGLLIIAIVAVLVIVVAAAVLRRRNKAPKQ